MDVYGLDQGVIMRSYVEDLFVIQSILVLIWLMMMMIIITTTQQRVEIGQNHK